MRTYKTALLLIVVLAVCLNAVASTYPFGSSDPKADFERLKVLNVRSLSQEELTSLGWYYSVYENSKKKAEEIFIEAITKNPRNAWAIYGMAVLKKNSADYKAEMKYSLMLCRVAPGHPLSEIAFNNLRQLVGKVDGIIGPGGKLLNDAIFNNRIKDPYTLNIAAAALNSINSLKGDPEAWDNVRERLNFINEWRFAGPFGPYENLAFLSALPPESDEKLREKYEFMEEEIVTRDYRSDNGMIDPFFMKSGVYIGETFLKTERPEDIVLFISSGKSIKCSLNGMQIYEKDLIRNYCPAMSAVAVRLDKGWNRLRVKLVSYAGRNISIRILAPDGTVPDVKVSYKPHKVSGYGVPETVAVMPSPGVQYFSKISQANPKDLLAPLLLGICHSLTGDLEKTKESLYHSLNIEPDWAYCNYLLAQTLERDKTQPTDIARGESKKRFERAIELAGEYPSALSALAAHNINENREKEGIEKLKQIVEQAPGFYAWHKKLYDLYTAKGWQKERYGEFLKVIDLLHESTIPLTMQRDYYYAKGDFNKYTEAVRKLQQSAINGKHMASFYRRAGDTDEAIREYKRLKKLRPYDRGIYFDLAKLYEQKGKFRSAQKEIEKLHSFFPKDTAIMMRLAQLYSLDGSGRKAEKMYRRILEENPLNIKARKALELGGDEDFFEQFEIDVWQYINDTNQSQKYKSFSSTIIIDQTVERVFPNGASMAQVHQLILVTNKQGIEQWAEVKVPANSEILELRTIKQNGTIVEPEPVPGKKSVSMTGTAEGDYIDMKYIIRAAPVFGKRKALLGRRFYFKTLKNPMVISQYILAAPKDIELDIEQIEMDDIPQRWEENGLSFYKWERREIPEVKPEPNAISPYEYIPNVHAGFNIDPEFQSKTTINSNLGAVKASREIVLKTKELTENLNSHSDKVRAIYDYVTMEIDGQTGSPVMNGGAGHILANKSGDRLTLMKTMLNTAGIRSNILMVMNKTIEKSAIFPGYYMYPLLAVQDTGAGTTSFIDLNRKYNTFGFIPPAYQGTEARILTDFPPGTEVEIGTQSWDFLSRRILTPTLPLTANGISVNVTLDIAKDGSVSGNLTDNYLGGSAAALRHNLQKIEKFSLRNNLEKSLGGNYRGATLEDFEIISLKEPDNPLGIVYKFSAPNYATVANSNLVFSQGFYRLDLGKTYVRVLKRETPMGLFSAYHYEHNIILNLPKGCQVDTMPGALSLENNFGTYNLEIKMTGENGNRIELHREFYMPIQKIYPEDYQDFVAFCREIDKAEEKDLIISLPPEPEPEEDQPVEEEDDIETPADENEREEVTIDT